MKNGGTFWEQPPRPRVSPVSTLKPHGIESIDPPDQSTRDRSQSQRGRQNARGRERLCRARRRCDALPV